MRRHSPPPMRHGGRVVDVIHHVTCRHGIGVEVWPARVELNFADERSVNPVNTQARFEATVINSDRSVTWSVLNLGGGPAAGSIDQSGLYRAPIKGGLASGTTDVVVATAKEDPLRKAFAWVTLIGEGPAPVPEPRIEILPKVARLYYPTGHDNAYIDASNTIQIFRASIHNSTSTGIQWRVDGVLQPAFAEEWFPYQLTSPGVMKTVTIEARLAAQPAVSDDAKVIQLNYDWPGV